MMRRRKRTWVERDSSLADLADIEDERVEVGLLLLLHEHGDLPDDNAQEEHISDDDEECVREEGGQLAGRR